MPSSRKVIITCAITGSSHTPTMSPGLPYTPEDIIRQSIEAAEAGAAVIHLHARDAQDGESPDVVDQASEERRVGVDCHARRDRTTHDGAGERVVPDLRRLDFEAFDPEDL